MKAQCIYYGCPNPAYRGYCTEHEVFRVQQERGIRIAQFALGFSTGIFVLTFIYYVFIR